MSYLIFLFLGGCPMGGDGCDGIHGPEGVSVTFVVAEEGQYTWSIVGDTEQMDCHATIPDGNIDCGNASFAFTGPEAVEDGGWRFGSTLWTSGDASIDVTLASESTTLLDTDFAPDWQAVTAEGNCSDHRNATREFDLRDAADTGA